MPVLPLSAPLHGELAITNLDLAQAAELSGDPKLKSSGIKGTLDLRGGFEGTLGAPKPARKAALQPAE